MKKVLELLEVDTPNTQVLEFQNLELKLEAYQMNKIRF